MTAQKKSINLLTAAIEPQGQWDRIYSWTVNTAKYIIIITEMVVIVAIGYRFVLDGKIAALDAQIKVQNQIRQDRIEDETKMRSLLTSIDSVEKMGASKYSLSSYYDQIQILIPNGVTVTSFSIDVQGSSISGQVSSYDSLLQLEENLKEKTSILKNVQVSTNQSGDSSINFTISFNLKIDE